MHTSISSVLRSTLSLVVLFALCTLGPAPIRGDKYNIKPHTNLQPQDEKSLEAQQQLQRVMPQVGAVSAPHADQQMRVDGNSQDATAILSRAQRTDGTANQVLGAANSRIAPTQSKSWLWALLVVGGVLAGIVGVKRWADNNIPNLPTVAPKRQGW